MLMTSLSSTLDKMRHIRIVFDIEVQTMKWNEKVFDLYIFPIKLHISINNLK